MINRDSYLNLLRSEASDSRYDISYCEKEVAFAEVMVKSKGVKRKERKMWKSYISYLKKRRGMSSKNLKRLDKLICLTANLEAS